MASQLKTLAAINLTVAGTRQKLSATTLEVEVLYITAAPANTGFIFIGDANVSSTRYMARLDGADRIEIRPGQVGSGNSDFLDLSEIYFDGDTTNDDILIGYIAKAN